MEDMLLICPVCGYHDRGPAGISCTDCGNPMIEEDVSDIDKEFDINKKYDSDEFETLDSLDEEDDLDDDFSKNEDYGIYPTESFRDELEY